jgi:DNA-binding transcriptional regulator LsrR (DeoR family)
MSNPISDTTAALLDSLDAELREQAEADVRSNSKRAAGFELSLAEEINLAKAIKTVAGVDGLSREELAALEFLMIMAALPYDAQQHVVGYQTEGTTLEHVAELFPPGSQKACYLVSGATTVAAMDGLSADEERSARELGERLQLSDRVVSVLIAEARAMGLAMRKGDRDLVDELERLRAALFGFF